MIGAGRRASVVVRMVFVRKMGWGIMRDGRGMIMMGMGMGI